MRFLQNALLTKILFAYFQIGIDAFIITLIVYITGGFVSYFSFLYLVVVIYASMILFLWGGLIIATWSSFQYAILLVCSFHPSCQLLE